MSWKDLNARSQARCIASVMLEAIVMDDEAFALANLNLTGVSLEDQRGNMDEAEAKWQNVIRVLSESKVRL